MTYYGSYFDNGNAALGWENPFLGPTDAGQLALPPDNESHQLAFAGAIVLPARTTLSGQLSVGALAQDESLLPYTVNPLIATAPLPMSSTDAKADTLNLNLRAVSSPWRKITLEGEVRYNDFDNSTPTSFYDYVITDATVASTPVANVAHDYERRDVKARAEYRLSSSHRFHVGLDARRFRRTFQAY